MREFTQIVLIAMACIGFLAMIRDGNHIINIETYNKIQPDSYKFDGATNDTIYIYKITNY